MARKTSDERVRTEEAAEPRHIQSIPLGFKLVKFIESASSPMTLKEISAAVGMDTGHAHLYLTSFKMVGLVQQAGAGGAYTLGRYAVQLGLSALRKLDLADEARGPMLKLQHQTGLTVYISVWGNHGPTIVSKVDGSFPFPMTIRVGYVLPLLTTATGHVFIGYLPLSETRPLLELEAVAMRGSRGEKLDATPAAIRKLVQRVQAHGIAQTGSAVNAGFAAMSAPVLDHESRICAALSILGPVGAFDVRLDGAPALALKQAATSISHSLGCSLSWGMRPDA